MDELEDARNKEQIVVVAPKCVSLRHQVRCKGNFKTNKNTLEHFLEGIIENKPSTYERIYHGKQLKITLLS